MNGKYLMASLPELEALGSQLHGGVGEQGMAPTWCTDTGGLLASAVSVQVSCFFLIHEDWPAFLTVFILKDLQMLCKQ